MLLNKHFKKSPSDQELKDVPSINRSVSAPESAETLDTSDLILASCDSKTSLKRVQSLVWNYVQNFQESVTNKGKFVHKALKKKPLASLIAQIQNISSSLAQSFRVVKRLFSYLSGQKTLLLIAYLSLGVTCLSQLMIPKLTSEMIDNRQNDKLVKKAQEFLVICLVYSVSEFFWSYFFALISQNLRFSLKRQIYSIILQREIEFHDKKPLQEILDCLNGKISTVERIFPEQISNLVRYLAQLLSSAFMLASISYKLVLVLILSVPIHLVIPLIYNKIRDRFIFGENKTAMAVSGKVIETLQNIRIIRAFSMEDKEISTFQGLQAENIDAMKKGTLAWAINMGATGFYTNFNLICIVYVGMTLVHTGEVSVGSLSGFLMLSIGIATAFRDFSLSYISLKSSLPICQELFNLLDEKPKVPYQGGKILENFEGNVEFSNVSFHYPKTPDVKVLKDLSLNISAGESAAFVGMSGGGKSTIISLLLRFYDVTNGGVKLDGIDIRDIDLKWLHNQIGYVSQDPILFSGTIEENIAYGLEDYSQETLKRVIEMANAKFVYNENLFSKGLKSDIGERGGRLSGGQKQRLSIARALMREPKILILDEATSSLDANAEFEVQQAIDNLLTSTKMTLITIAHRLSTIKKCSKIFVLKTGEIIEEGSHEKLFQKGGAYKTLVEKQSQDHH